MMVIMGVKMRIWGIGAAVLLLSACMSNAWALDCDSYTGTKVDTTKDVATLVGKGIAAVRGHNVRGLFALSGSKLIYLRRSVTDTSSEGRAGNIRLALRPRDMDASLNVRIGNQLFDEFAGSDMFDGLDTASAISVPREVCEGASRCDDALPSSEGVPFLMKNLLQCNQNGKGIYLFSDGIFITDMQLNGGKVPLGAALFFAKGEKGYYLAGLIAQR
jgi:hypothetical protein